ncbi:MAG: penicillin-binding protein 2, partial [Candidatus Cryptobacteroides sp.]
MVLDRTNKLLIGLCVVAIILIIRLFVIQIVDDKYKIDASNNSMVHSIIYPTRGIIYDRNGKILVGNKITYDLLVTPREVTEFDTLAFCQALDVPVDFVKDKMAEYRKNRRRIGYQTLVMLKQLSPERYMRFAEVAYKFPGFRGQARSSRDYPYDAGGNLLGYVSEVDAGYISRHPEYKSGDYAGMTGIEAARETELRGEKGYH